MHFEPLVHSKLWFEVVKIFCRFWYYSDGSQELSLNCELFMFENIQFFDWRTVTSKARSAAGKHFLITNKVLGSISRIIALRWYKNYSCVRRRSGGNQIFTKFPGHDPRFDGWAGFQISTLYMWKKRFHQTWKIDFLKHSYFNNHRGLEDKLSM